MKPQIVTVEMEIASGKGEDSLIHYEGTELRVVGVFDGLGGRSAGHDGMTGGQIASKMAAELTGEILQQQDGQLTEAVALELQEKIRQALKAEAAGKMGTSRLRGTLTGKRLCTTVALAALPIQAASGADSVEIGVAWMGDSRVYFLSPTYGLQQLTADDLEVKRDAFQMIREDPPMSQYLTADMPDPWRIHFLTTQVDENGCVIACTDGCFQYLPAPWDFERLLLDTLSSSETMADWQHFLQEAYRPIKQDDIALVLSPLGFANFASLKHAYAARRQELQNTFYTGHLSLPELWERYRRNYEARLNGQAPAPHNNVEPEPLPADEGQTVADPCVESKSNSSAALPAVPIITLIGIGLLSIGMAIGWLLCHSSSR